MKRYIFLACAFVLIIGTMVYGIVINNQNKLNTDLTMQNNTLIAQIDTTIDRYNKLQEDYNLLCETHKSTLNQLQQERSLYAFDRQRFTEQVQSLKQQIFDLNVNKEENDEEKGRFVRKERYSGACSRSFYVGENITEDEIKAKFKNGTLTIVVPKKEDKKELPSKKYIEIE